MFSTATPITLAQARSTAAKLRALGIHHIDADDVMQDAWLLVHDNPILTASNLIAILINKGKQSRRQSIIACVSISPISDTDTELVDVANPDDYEIEQWRLADDEDLAALGWSIFPETLRNDIMSTGKVGERRARQIIQLAIQRLGNTCQLNLFN